MKNENRCHCGLDNVMNELRTIFVDCYGEFHKVKWKKCIMMIFYLKRLFKKIKRFEGYENMTELLWVIQHEIEDAKQDTTAMTGLATFLD